MKLFANFVKKDADQRMVWGYASTEAMDSQGEVVKLDAIKGAWDDYMQFANIREMHQPSAVGKCKEYEFDEKGILIGVKVVDDNAWKKVQEEVYTGFSIGGKALAKVSGTITQLRLSEISLVDRPSNPEALITIWKGEALEDDSSGTANGSSDTGDKNSLDGQEEKTKLAISDLKKYSDDQIYDSQVAIRALEAAAWLLGKESGKDGEPQEQISALKAVVENLKVFIASEIMKPDDSEVAMSEKVQDLVKGFSGEQVEKFKKLWKEMVLRKAGAKFSSATKSQLSDLHKMVKSCDEHLTKMGYMGDEDEEKFQSPDGLKKIADLEDVVSLQKATLDQVSELLKVEENGTIQEAIQKLFNRVSELESEPKDLKGVKTRVIGKGEDVDTGSEDPLEKALESVKTPEDLATMVMKFIHRTGAVRVD